MASVIEFHPPLTPFSATPNPEDPESYLLNVSFCVQLARDAGTPQGDALYRAFVSEWHALHGQPLSPEKREEVAWRAACAKVGWTLKTLK